MQMIKISSILWGGALTKGNTVLFIFPNVFNELKSGQQSGLFLRVITAVRSKSIWNSCNTIYLVQFKSKYEPL